LSPQLDIEFVMHGRRGGYLPNRKALPATALACTHFQTAEERRLSAPSGWLHNKTVYSRSSPISVLTGLNVK